MNDGSPYKGFFKKQIVVQRIHEGDPSDVITEEKLVIPDDHVVRYSFLPEQNDRKITVRVSTGVWIQCFFILLCDSTYCYSCISIFRCYVIGKITLVMFICIFLNICQK